MRVDEVPRFIYFIFDRSRIPSGTSYIPLSFSGLVVQVCHRWEYNFAPKFCCLVVFFYCLSFALWILGVLPTCTSRPESGLHPGILRVVTLI